MKNACTESMCNLAVRTGKESAGKDCACKVNWCDELRRSHAKALFIVEN